MESFAAKMHHLHSGYCKALRLSVKLLTRKTIWHVSTQQTISYEL